MKILIIEDEKRLAWLLKQGLEEQGFTVDLAHDGVKDNTKPSSIRMTQCCST